MSICATDVVYHYFFQPDPDTIESVLQSGLRPLSDFPTSERWQQIQTHMPDFFQTLYNRMVEPILKKPYPNSGIFLTPIDFYQLPETILAQRPRVRIPVDRIDAEWAILTYELKQSRAAEKLSMQVLQQTADMWSEDLIREWFGKDPSRVFYFVPQVAAYQPGGIVVLPEDFNMPPLHGTA